MFIAALFFVQPAFAQTFAITPGSDLVGEIQYVTSVKGDTLHTIARAHDIGMLEIEEANPHINPEKTLVAGTKLLIPTEYILPPGDREGIVINLAELRAYYFPPGQNIVMTFPLGIGQVGWRTPIGETTIIRKREHPDWTPPPSIQAEAESRGRSLPAVVPAGPNNPLGDYAMNLGWNGYMMHGTRAPTSIGLRSSHGCMRMYPEDIDALFHSVEIGTKVRAIYEPYKMGMKDGKLYLEAHEMFPDNYYKIKHDDKFATLGEVVSSMNYPDKDKINWFEVKDLMKETNGYPVDITSPVPGNPKNQTATNGAV